jgi:hypothetical protein
VLLGNGSGGLTWSALAGNPRVQSPVAAVAGDFNGDGKLDLAEVYSGEVVVTLGALANTSSYLSTSAGSAIAYGTPVPLQLLVSGGFNAPSGTATFLDGTTVLGTATQTASPYTFTASSLAVGSHTLNGSYGGDSRNNPSTSASSNTTITIVVKNAATVTLGNLVVTYDGTPKPATATTNPSGLAVTITYNGSSTPPTLPGSYTVVASVNDPNYVGSATGTLVISGITFVTSPAGLQISVDGGTPQVAPFILSLPDGSHTIYAPGQPTGAGTGYAFVSWSDGGAATHSIPVTRTPVTYTATFGLGYQLTAASSPAAGGTVSPASGAYFVAGALVSVQATANPGYQFANFSGSLAGSANPRNITLNGPANVVANFTASRPNLAASVGARTDVVPGVTRQVILTLTNTGAGPATNATITSITAISVVLGSGSVSVASGIPVDVGTIGTAAAANAAVVFNWPTTATKVKFTVNYTAGGGYSGSTTITTLR